MSTHTDGTKSYTIKEVSRLSGLPASTLRYYETIGIIQSIDRDANSKHRVYSREDVDLIDAIACLSATGMSLDDMRAYLDNRNKGVEGADDEIALLEAQKQRLVEEAKFLEHRQRYVELKVAYWQAVKVGDTKNMESVGEEARKLAQSLKFPMK